VREYSSLGYLGADGRSAAVQSAANSARALRDAWCNRGLEAQVWVYRRYAAGFAQSRLMHCCARACVALGVSGRAPGGREHTDACCLACNARSCVPNGRLATPTLLGAAAAAEVHVPMKLDAPPRVVTIVV
jgi:hypothetical protein